MPPSGSAPFVTVIVPSLNQGQYIGEALDSIFAQTYKDYEVIVVDGGSTDGTAAAVGRYGDKVLFFRQSGKGVSRAKNQALERARGRFIAFLDADDAWYPDKLARQVALLEDHPEYGFCSSDVDFFDETGITIRSAIGAEKKPRSGMVFDDLFANNFISSATIILRRECFEKVGRFDEEIFYAEDTEMWIRVAKEFSLGYISESLSRYRVRPEARSQSFARHYASLALSYGKLKGLYPDYFAARPALLRSAYFNLYRRWAYRHFAVGEYAEARKIYLRALRYAPLDRSAWVHLVASYLPRGIIERLKRE
jgi:glycosyltransferase involved in cell wall biosynthesis